MQIRLQALRPDAPVALEVEICRPLEPLIEDRKLENAGDSVGAGLARDLALDLALDSALDSARDLPNEIPGAAFQDETERLDNALPFRLPAAVAHAERP